MVDTISELNLPRLPQQQAAYEAFQVWWQIVVQQIEDAVNALNLSIAQLQADEETNEELLTRLAVTESRLRATLLVAQEALQRVEDAETEIAAVDGSIASLWAAVGQIRRRLDNMEVEWQP